MSLPLLLIIIGLVLAVLVSVGLGILFILVGLVWIVVEQVRAN